VDGEDGFQIRRLPGNVLNMQSGIDERLDIVTEANNSAP
jgi:hypothetical protein